MRVSYQVEELTTPGLSDLLAKFVHEHEPLVAGGVR
jgi:hypothetical protein